MNLTRTYLSRYLLPVCLTSLINPTVHLLPAANANVLSALCLSNLWLPRPSWRPLTTWFCCVFVFVCLCVDDVCVCFVSQDSYSSQCVSKPPTPSPMSPSSASLSSCHGEDSDSISSPAWPKTSTSPVSAKQNCFWGFCVCQVLGWKPSDSRGSENPKSSLRFI